MAIAMAREGGIGVLHRNLSIEDQAYQVDLVKRTQTGIISNPVTIGPDATLEDLDRICGEYRVSGLPVVDVDNRLLGIITNRDLRFTPVAEWATTKVDEVMTSEGLITGAGRHLPRRRDRPAARPQARAAAPHRRGRSPRRADHGQGLRQVRAVPARLATTPTAASWSARPSATSVTPGSGPRRWSRPASTCSSPTPPTATSTCSSTWSAGSRRTRRPSTCRSSAATSRPARARRPSSTPGPTPSRSASGPGSICTTRVVTGVGVPQVTAVYEASLATQAGRRPADRRRRHEALRRDRQGHRRRRRHRDARLACSPAARSRPARWSSSTASSSSPTAAWARSARCRSRGKKSYSKDRYFQAEVTSDDKIVPEGIEGQVAYRGPLGAVAHQLIGGLSQSMFYVGARTVPELQETRPLRPDHLGLAQGEPPARRPDDRRGAQLLRPLTCRSGTRVASSRRWRARDVGGRR